MNLLAQVGASLLIFQMRSLTSHSLGIDITDHCHGRTRDHPEKAADLNPLPCDTSLELWSAPLVITCREIAYIYDAFQPHFRPFHPLLW